MTDTLKSAKAFLLDRCGSERRVLVAVSGGLDSMCLLHLMHTWGASAGFCLTAAHFNHQLRGETADRDEDFVRSYCKRQGIAFVAGRGDTRALANAEGLSSEEAARRLRYDFLSSAVKEAGCAHILTAHHADDNAETMLLNLLRGTGSRGLAGIPAERGQVLRPFLALSREDLAAYTAAHQIPHVEDETNYEDAAARNILRHRVLPVLRELNPRAVEHMARTAAILTREDEALQGLAASLTATAESVPGGVCMRWSSLAAAPKAVAERAVFDLLEQVCGKRKDLSAVHAAAVLALGARGERHLPYGLRARRQGGLLWVGLAPERDGACLLALDQDIRWGDYFLRCEKKVLQGVPKPHTILLNWERLDGPVTVGPWRAGDGLCLGRGRGRRSLKRLFADGHISPQRRDAWPVIYVADRPVAVFDLAVDEDFLPQSGGLTLEITVRYCTG